MAPTSTDEGEPRGAEAPVDARDVRIAELEERLAAGNAQVTAGNARIAELEALVAKLTAQVEELTEKLRQDSTNSHRPPSSDGPGAAGRRKAEGGRGSKPKKSKRKRGGQKGHRGAHRALLPPEQVHEFVDLFPSSCRGCSRPLPEIPDCDSRRHQVIDLVPYAPHIKEFRRHEVSCPHCGHETRAAYDPAIIPSSPFGPRLTTMVIMLTGVYHLSRERTRRLISDFFGFEISVGAISAMEKRASEALVSAVAEAEREVQRADVKHADATAWLLAGITMSLWTLASSMVTVYRIFENGRRETIQSWFGALVGILVSDRAAVFGFWAMARRQICHAHLLRLFVSFSQRDGPAGNIGHELLDLSGLLFEYWHGFRAEKLTRARLVELMRPVQEHFEAALERAVAAEIPRLSGSCEDILAHKEALWTFVTCEGTGPTNNHAELMLRPLVLWRRRSFGCQSERGLRFVERIMTVTQTCRKQGKNLLDYITARITAHRDGTMPPALLARAS